MWDRISMELQIAAAGSEARTIAVYRLDEPVPHSVTV